MVNPVSGSRKSQAKFSMDQTAQSLTCSIMEIPHTGLDECAKFLLSCFRARNSGGGRDKLFLSPAAFELSYPRTNEPTRNDDLRSLCFFGEEMDIINVIRFLMILNPPEFWSRIRPCQA